MKKLPRCLSLLIALAMLLPMFGAAAFAEERPTLKVALSTSAMVTDYKDNYLTKYLEDKLGIEIVLYMLPVEADDTSTKIALMATSEEDLPDVFVIDGFLNDEMILAYGESGLFKELDAYIKDPEKMPNYCAIPDEDRSFMTMASTQANGHVYSLASYEPETWNMTPYRMFINRTWLDALNLAVPTTTEELKQVLIAFRDGDPNGNGIQDEIGVYGQASGGYGQNVTVPLMNAFLYWNGNAINTGLALSEEDYETVIAPYTTEAWREGLRYLHDLYAEGLLSADTFTDDNNTYKAVLNQDVQIVGMTSSGSLSSWPSVATNPAFAQMQLIAPLSGPQGVNYTPFLEIWPTQELMICDSTEKLDLALRFADEFYSFDTSMVVRFGEENVDWSRDPALLEGQSNAYLEVGLTDRISYLVITNIWAANQNKTWRNHGPRYMGIKDFLQVYDYSTGEKYDPENPIYLNGKCYEMYYFNKPQKLLPKLKFTADETEALIDIKPNVHSYVRQALAEFTTGTRDIETGWEKYLAELDDMGLQQLISISQDAYNRIR